ncbi:hypothetical protein B5S33_g1075 [[Candida] boidinii]|nr:hypothetical protein B5S27_g1346 [[Candida] boidinii]OWB82449.1 hypothetical protein B5S33_g1075 [[Candida] boidinii]
MKKRANTKRPTIPKKLLQGLSASKDNKKKKEPTTLDELFTDGVDQEESGDRWLSSDLAKALRFYQLSFTSYKKCLEIDPTYFDGIYNLSRLLLSVYNNFIKNEAVNVNLLVNVADAISGDGVIQSLIDIIRFYENSLNTIENNQVSGLTKLPIDMYYNAALCYFELIEDIISNENIDDVKFNDIVLILNKAQLLFNKVLKEQVAELDNVISSFTIDESEEDKNNQSQSPKDEEYASIEETVTPSVVLDTVLNCYRLISTTFEAAITDYQVKKIEEVSESFISDADTISRTLLERFQDKENSLGINDIDVIPNLTIDEADELKLTKITYNGSKLINFNELVNNWENENCKIEAFDINRENFSSFEIEYLMAKAESYSNLLEKSEDESFINKPSDQAKWDILSTQSTIYKACFDLIKIEFQKSSKGINNEHSKNLLSLCTILIQRCDVDIKRSILTNEQAIKSRDILKKNAITFLKSCILYSNQSGGLKETITDKLLKQKRRTEAFLRLTLIEKNFSEEVISKHAGDRINWETELEEILYLNIYDKL